MRQRIRQSAIAFVILIVIGFAAGTLRPEWTEGMLRLFTDAVGAGLYELDAGALFTALLVNNLFSALAPIAVGLIPFLHLSAFSLGLNALLVGAFAAYYRTSRLGLAAYLAGTLPHGVTELAALSVACGAGLYLCDTVTGRILGREDTPPAAQVIGEALRVYARAVVPLLFVSALIEAFVTPRILSLFV